MGTVGPTIVFADFERVDLQGNTIVSAEPFPQALKLLIDSGPSIGRNRSWAKITRHDTPETLVGRQVAAVVNLPARQTGPFLSEVLTLRFPDEDGDVVPVMPNQDIAND